MNKSWRETKKANRRRAEIRRSLRKVFRGPGLWESDVQQALFQELRARANCCVAYKYDVNMAMITMTSRAPLLECNDVYEIKEMDA